MGTRIFLLAVGLLYLYLAVWCSLFPARTSELVGFQLRPGTGQSEFLTVYGGLELALAIIFLRPLLQPRSSECALFVCLTLHGCLVLFRTAGFFLFPVKEPMVYQLAAGEWLIFLGAGVLMLLNTLRLSGDNQAAPR
jgi:hypothetical protein